MPYILDRLSYITLSITYSNGPVDLAYQCLFGPSLELIVGNWLSGI
jgi:hypothetical protein